MHIYNKYSRLKADDRWPTFEIEICGCKFGIGLCQFPVPVAIGKPRQSDTAHTFTNRLVALKI